eukprot:m.362721 g.362721  ORF g.362721 m.362721 type:complete len:1655 (+) comp20812_c0_seq1:185-5149(+)
MLRVLVLVTVLFYQCGPIIAATTCSSHSSRADCHRESGCVFVEYCAAESDGCRLLTSKDCRATVGCELSLDTLACHSAALSVMNNCTKQFMDEQPCDLANGCEWIGECQPSAPCTDYCHEPFACGGHSDCLNVVDCVLSAETDPDRLCQQPCIDQCLLDNVGNTTSLPYIDRTIACGEQCFLALPCTGNSDCLDHQWCDTSTNQCHHCVSCFDDSVDKTACQARCEIYQVVANVSCGLCSCQADDTVSCRFLSHEQVVSSLAVIPETTRFLDLWHNRLTFLPHDTFVRLTHLEVLLISLNRLTTLNISTLSLPLLHTLDANFNLISSLGHDSFRGTPQLRSLSLSHNLLSSISDSALRTPHSLSQLVLSGNFLTYVPSTIWSLPLQTIDLSRNRITSLSEHFFAGVWSGIQKVSLASNPLKLLEDTPFAPFEQAGLLRLVDLSETQLPPALSRTALQGLPQWVQLALPTATLPCSDNTALHVTAYNNASQTVFEGSLCQSLSLTTPKKKWKTVLQDPAATLFKTFLLEACCSHEWLSSYASTYGTTFLCFHNNSAYFLDDFVQLEADALTPQVSCSCLSPQQQSAVADVPLELDPATDPLLVLPRCPRALLGLPAHNENVLHHTSQGVDSCTQVQPCYPDCTDLSQWLDISKALNSSTILRLALRRGLTLQDFIAEVLPSTNLFLDVTLELQHLERAVARSILPQCAPGHYPDMPSGEQCVATFHGVFHGVSVSLNSTILVTSVGIKYCRACATSHCQVCDPLTAGQVCLSCTPPFVLDGLSCVRQCPPTSGIRQNSTVCQPCQDPNCNSCHADASSCTGCRFPYVLSGNSCRADCPPGLFAAGVSDLVCQTCHTPNCSRCNAHQCLACFAGNVLYNGKCLERCPSRTYPVGSGNIVCVPCSEPFCDACPGDLCTACGTVPSSTNASAVPYFLLDGRCVSEAICEATDGRLAVISTSPEPFTTTEAVCSRCSTTNCKSCIDEGRTCVVCTDYQFLLEGQCLASCPPRFREVGSGKFGRACQPCGVYDCLLCPDSLTRCSECTNNKYLTPDNSQCTHECPTGTRSVQALEGRLTGKQCVSCPAGANCQTCSADSCLSCSPDSSFTRLFKTPDGKTICVNRAVVQDTASSRLLTNGGVAGITVGLLVCFVVVVGCLLLFVRRRSRLIKEYHVFISYRHGADSALAKAICKGLQREFLQSGHRIRCFLDVQDIAEGDNWSAAFCKALSRSCLYLPLISTNSLDAIRHLRADPADYRATNSTDNFLTEIELALDLEAKNQMVILPLLVPSAPSGDDKGEGTPGQSDIEGEADGHPTLKKFSDFDASLYPTLVHGQSRRCVQATLQALFRFQGIFLARYQDLDESELRTVVDILANRAWFDDPEASSTTTPRIRIPSTSEDEETPRSLGLIHVWKPSTSRRDELVMDFASSQPTLPQCDDDSSHTPHDPGPTPRNDNTGSHNAMRSRSESRSRHASHALVTLDKENLLFTLHKWISDIVDAHLDYREARRRQASDLPADSAQPQADSMDKVALSAYRSIERARGAVAAFRGSKHHSVSRWHRLAPRLTTRRRRRGRQSFAQELSEVDIEEDFVLVSIKHSASASENAPPSSSAAEETEFAEASTLDANTVIPSPSSTDELSQPEGMAIHFEQTASEFDV